MKNIKVSIIMPSLNVAKYIGDSISSVIKQTLNEIEIICVDAGSTDGTIEILEEFSKKDERIKIINSKEKSYGYQVNIGIKEAKGEFIGIVETDDFVECNMFEELYNRATKTNAEVVKMPFIEYMNSEIANVCYYAEKLNRTLPNNCFSAIDHGEILAYHASVWAGIYKKEYLINNNILFVEAPGAGYVDVGFRFDTCINTEKIAWLNKPLYFYRTNNSDSSTNNFKLSVMIQRWKEIQIKAQEIKETYNEFYSPYLVLDEYLNTLKYMSSIKVTFKEMKEIHELFSSIKREKINSSPVLPNYIKKRIIDFVDNPVSYYKKAQITAYVKTPITRIVNKCFAKGTKRRETLKSILLLSR